MHDSHVSTKIKENEKIAFHHITAPLVAGGAYPRDDFRLFRKATLSTEYGGQRLETQETREQWSSNEQSPGATVFPRRKYHESPSVPRPFSVSHTWTHNARLAETSTGWPKSVNAGCSGTELVSQGPTDIILNC